MLDSVCIFQNFLSLLPIHSPVPTENPIASKIRVFETQCRRIWQRKEQVVWPMSTALWDKNPGSSVTLGKLLNLSEPSLAPISEDEANDPLQSWWDKPMMEFTYKGPSMFSHMWEALNSHQPASLLLSNCPAPKLSQPPSTPWISVLGAWAHWQHADVLHLRPAGSQPLNQKWQASNHYLEEKDIYIYFSNYKRHHKI